MLYKKVSSADSPIDLSATTVDAFNANQNSLVIDFDLGSGSITINLPSIESLLFNISNSVGAGAMTFYMKGTIL